MHRRSGSVLVDILGGVSGLALLFTLSISAVREATRAHGDVARASDLEQAQNALARARAGEDLALPPGWSVRTTDLAPGVRRLEVRSGTVHLATLVRAPAAQGTP